MASTSYNRRIAGKDKNELLDGLGGEIPGSVKHEQEKMAIFVRCTEDLETAISSFAKSSDRLSKQVLILNVIFGIFTIVGTVFTVWQIVKY